MKYSSLGVLVALLFFTTNILNAAESKEVLSKEEQAKCQAFCPYTPPTIKKKRHKRKKIAQPSSENKESLQAIVIVVQESEHEAKMAELPTTTKETEQSPDYWLKVYTGLGFAQYDITDKSGNSGKIMSNSLLSVKIENVFKLDSNFLMNAYLGLDSISLESPQSQQLSHSNNSLYNFGLGLSWVGVDKLTVGGALGYKDELYFRNFSSPSIAVDKFLVPYVELKAKYYLISKKTLKLGGQVTYDYESGFTSSTSGVGNYGINGSNGIGFSLLIQKEFKSFTMEAAISNNEKFKSSDQGKIKDNEVGVGVNFLIPLEWSEK